MTASQRKNSSEKKSDERNALEDSYTQFGVYTSREKSEDKFKSEHRSFFLIKKNKQLADYAKKGNIEALGKSMGDVDQSVIKVLFSFAVIFDQVDVMKFLLEKCKVARFTQEAKELPFVHLAARSSSIAALKFFQDEIKAINQDGESVLHVAAASNNLDVVEYLAESKLDVSVVDRRGRTALHSAAENGCLKIAKYLVRKCKLQVEQPDKQGVAPLLLAAHSGDSDTVDYFFSHYKRKDVERVVDKEGRNIFHYAALGERGATMSAHLKEECEVKINVQDHQGRTALYLLVERGASYIATRLIDDCKVDYSLRTKQHKSVLHVAVANMHLQNPREGKDYYDLVKILVEECKLDINIQDSNKRTPLHNAVRYDHVDTVKKLIQDFKPDLEAKDHNGRTALHFAAILDAPEMLEVLVEKHADCRVKDNNGCTPLDCARAHQKAAAINILEAAEKSVKRKQLPEGAAEQGAAKRARHEAAPPAGVARTISRQRSYGQHSGAGAGAGSGQEFKPSEFKPA